MKTELIQTLTSTFEAHAQQTEGGVEFWLARDLQHLLGYTKWDNFLNVVSKAKTACEVSGHQVSYHFTDVGKTIRMPKSAEKEVPDLMLTRYACYLITQNGDPKKQEIAFAQTYFAIQTRRAELIEQRFLEACFNPNGIGSISPGLRGTSYPGWTVSSATTPTGLQQRRCADGHNPFRVEDVCFTASQGSLADSATLGWMTESLWDSRMVPPPTHWTTTHQN